MEAANRSFPGSITRVPSGWRAAPGRLVFATLTWLGREKNAPPPPAPNTLVTSTRPRPVFGVATTDPWVEAAFRLTTPWRTSPMDWSARVMVDFRVAAGAGWVRSDFGMEVMELL